jgi:glucose/arabinose dehydrogenase
MRYRRLASTACLVALLAFADVGAASALPRGTRVATYKRGLNFPIDMAWVKNTRRIFFTEKNTGKVRVLVGRRLRRRPCVDLDVNSAGERGALGLVLHPRFKRTRYLYVYYTNASPLENRVTRFTVRNNRCRNPRTIVRRIQASSSGYHNGGQLEFVGRHLFISTGEAHDPARAQWVGDRHGKVLRVTANGAIPRSNPFRRRGRRTRVWSYGHRNPFGLTHEPGTRRLYATENGPECDDEINRIRKGRNYGWGPGYTCGGGVGPNPKRPLYRWPSIVVPTDPWWYRGRLRRLSGSLYVGEYGTGRLHRFVLNRKGSRVRSHRTIFTAARGIVDVSKGPGGWLYYMTSSSIRRIVRR